MSETTYTEESGQGEAAPETQREGRSDAVEQFQSIREDLRHLGEDLAAFGQAVLDAGKDQAGDAKLRLQEEAQRRLESLRGIFEDARAQGQRTVGRVEQQIEARPMTSVVIAFLAGLFFGKIMDRGIRRY